MGTVIVSIHEKRDEFRRELQQAAGRSKPAPDQGATSP
jgi:hypothetical protein